MRLSTPLILFILIFIVVSVINIKKEKIISDINKEIKITTEPINNILKAQYFFDKAYSVKNINKSFFYLNLSKKFLNNINEKKIIKAKELIGYLLKNKILTQNAQKKFHEYLSLSIIDYIKENSNLLQKLQNVKNTINNNTLFVQYLLVFLGLSLFIISFIFHKYKEIKKINYQDYLTGAFNRKKFFDITENLSQNYNTVVMMDIDHFKKINDTYGHSKGDLVLKEIVEIIKENIRKDDLIFRWGGEEFLILFKDVDAQTAFNIIQKIKNLIETHDFDGIKVTASFGIKECKEKITEKDLILVDKALYKAKEKRNDIVLVN